MKRKPELKDMWEAGQWQSEQRREGSPARGCCGQEEERLKEGCVCVHAYVCVCVHRCACACGEKHSSGSLRREGHRHERGQMWKPEQIRRADTQNTESHSESI